VLPAILRLGKSLHSREFVEDDTVEQFHKADSLTKTVRSTPLLFQSLHFLSTGRDMSP
jgi:hypothetical protein